MYKIVVYYNQPPKPRIIKKYFYASKQKYLLWKERHTEHYAKFGDEYKVKGYTFTGIKWKENKT